MASRPPPHFGPSISPAVIILTTFDCAEILGAIEAGAAIPLKDVEPETIAQQRERPPDTRSCRQN